MHKVKTNDGWLFTDRIYSIPLTDRGTIDLSTVAPQFNITDYTDVTDISLRDAIIQTRDYDMLNRYLRTIDSIQHRTNAQYYYSDVDVSESLESIEEEEDYSYSVNEDADALPGTPAPRHLPPPGPGAPPPAPRRRGSFDLGVRRAQMLGVPTQPGAPAIPPVAVPGVPPRRFVYVPAQKHDISIVDRVIQIPPPPKLRVGHPLAAAPADVYCSFNSLIAKTNPNYMSGAVSLNYCLYKYINGAKIDVSPQRGVNVNVTVDYNTLIYVPDRKTNSVVNFLQYLTLTAFTIKILDLNTLYIRKTNKQTGQSTWFPFVWYSIRKGADIDYDVVKMKKDDLRTATNEKISQADLVASMDQINYNNIGIQFKDGSQPFHVIYFILKYSKYVSKLPDTCVIYDLNGSTLKYKTSVGEVDYFDTVICDPIGNIPPLSDKGFLQNVVINPTTTYDTLTTSPFPKSRAEHVLRYSNSHPFNMPLIEHLLLNIATVGDLISYSNLFIVTNTANVLLATVVNTIPGLVDTLTSVMTVYPITKPNIELNPLPSYILKHAFIDKTKYKWDVSLRYSPDNTLASSMSLLRALINIMGSPITTNKIKQYINIFDPDIKTNVKPFNSNNMRKLNINYYRIVKPDECNPYVHTYIYPLFQILLIEAIDRRLINVSHIRAKLGTDKFMSRYLSLLTKISGSLKFAYRQPNGTYSPTVNITKKGKFFMRDTIENIPVTLENINKHLKEFQLSELYIEFNSYVSNIFVHNPTLYCPACTDGYMNLFSFIIAMKPSIIPDILNAELYIDDDVFWSEIDNFEPLSSSKKRLTLDFETFVTNIHNAAVQIFVGEDPLLINNMPGVHHYLKEAFDAGNLKGFSTKVKHYLLDLACIIPGFDINNIIYPLLITDNDDAYMVNINRIIDGFKLPIINGVSLERLFITPNVQLNPKNSLNGFLEFFAAGNLFLNYDADGNSHPEITSDDNVNAANTELATIPDLYTSIGTYIHTITRHCGIPIANHLIYIPTKKRSFTFHRALAYIAHKVHGLNINTMYFTLPDGTQEPLLYLWLRWTYPDPGSLKVQFGSNGRSHKLISIIDKIESWDAFSSANDMSTLCTSTKDHLMFVDAMFNDDTFPLEYYQNVFVKTSLDIAAIVNNKTYPIHRLAYDRNILLSGVEPFQMGVPLKRQKSTVVTPCYRNHCIAERIKRSRTEVKVPIYINEDIATFMFNEGLIDLDNTYYCDTNSGDVIPLSDILCINIGLSTRINNIAVIRKDIMHYNIAGPYIQTLNTKYIPKELTGKANTLMCLHTDNIWESDMYNWPAWDPHNPVNLSGTTTRLGNNEFYFGRAEQTFVVFTRSARMNGILQFDVMSQTVMTDSLVPNALSPNTFHMQTSTLAQRLAELAVLSDYVSYPEYLVYVSYKEDEAKTPHDKPSAIINPDNLVIMHWLKQANAVYATREFITFDENGDIDHTYTFNDVTTDPKLPFNGIHVKTTQSELDYVNAVAATANITSAIYPITLHINLIPHLIMFGDVSFERVCKVQSPIGIDIAAFYINEPIYFVNDDETEVLMSEVVKYIPPGEDVYFDYRGFYFNDRSGDKISVADVYKSIARDRFEHMIDGFNVDPAMMTTFSLYVTLMESVLFHLDFNKLVNDTKSFSFDNVYESDQYYGKLTLNEVLHPEPGRPPVNGTFRQLIDSLLRLELEPCSHPDDFVNTTYIKPVIANNSTVYKNIPANIVAQINAAVP